MRDALELPKNWTGGRPSTSQGVRVEGPQAGAHPEQCALAVPRVAQSKDVGR